MGPGPEIVDPKKWLAAGAGAEEMEAAARPAKTTSMAKIRITTFISGNLSTYKIAGFSYPESEES